MLKKFIRLCLIFILIGGGIIIYKQPAIREKIMTATHIFTPSLPAVKGINTNKAGDISNQLKSDVNNTINQAEKQALNIKVSDLLSFFNRTQKIANDLRSFQEYVKKEVANLGKKK
jgi:ABC-type bacteriocin/lantibiotic exporter with double-glycine peptidase domain